MPITVPDGISIKTDSTGKITDGVITGSATAPTGNIEGKYGAIEKKVNLGFTTGGNIVEGDLATITIDLTTATAPAASAFSITGSKLVDADGNTVSGVTRITNIQSIRQFPTVQPLFLHPGSVPYHKSG